MALPHSNLIWDFDRFGLRRLQQKTRNNYAVAADRVAVAIELDKFSSDMNNRDLRLSDRRQAMNSRKIHTVSPPHKNADALSARERSERSRGHPANLAHAAHPASHDL
jgi:hypothetical protein